MAKLKELLVREVTLRNRVEKAIENGLNTPIERRTRGFCEAKLAELKKLWTDYESVDQTINELLGKNPNTTTHKYITEDNYGKLESKYCQYVGELLDGIRSASEFADSTHMFQNQTYTEHEESVLPRISLPKFNGDYDAWRSFHDLFLVMVHNNGRLKPVQKLYYLKTSLTGDAEKLLRHTPITNEDYLPAFKKVKERYENKRILTNHQLKILTSQPKLTTETAVGLKSLIDTTEECLQQLRSLHIDTSTWDLLIIYLLVQKLPFVTLKLWEEYQGATQELPQYQQFKSFLDTRLKVLEAISDTLVPKSNQTKVSSKTNTKSYHALKADKCPACNEDHLLQRCSKYQNMDVKARRKLVMSTGRCFNCLSGEHSAKNCSSRYRCNRCKQSHHTTLHENLGTNTNKSVKQVQTAGVESKSDTNQLQQNNSDSNGESQVKSNLSHSATGSSISQTYLNREQSQTLLSTALVLAKGERGEPQVLRCLIDLGSESSFITSEACQRLQTVCNPATVTITGLSSSHTGSSTKQTKLKLRSCHDNGTTIEENFFVIEKITNNLPTRIIDRKNCQHFNNLKLADPNYWKPNKIDALLGAKVYAKIIREGIIKGTENTPTAIKTIFGWILFGAAENAHTAQNTKAFTIQTDELDTQLRKFWETEELTTKPLLTQDEKWCEEHFQTTHERLSTGRYQVKLPFFNNTQPVLGDSRQQAIKRFESLQRQFMKKPEFEQEYAKCLDEYLELDHMEEVSLPQKGEPHYYIPHHAVYKDNTTTKLRTVFDASAKTTNGTSLNQYMMKGPVLQPTLWATLLNWRKYKIVINADIEKMYRMIQIHPEHRTFQRIIWRHPKTGVLQDYQLKTVTFGTTSAPYLALKTLQQLAKDERHRWPQAADAIYNNFYVDDLLSGAEDVPNAKELQRQLIEIMTSAGFNLRKWASNDKQLLQDLPIEHVELKDALTFSDNESVKTLGIKWYPKIDEFAFVIKPFPQISVLTKRVILSGIASLYDPLGWIAPIIINAKLLMQKLWITGLSWDNPVSEEISDYWRNFVISLHQLEQLRIPRWIKCSATAHLQIHGFCDASSKAYGAVVYLRVEQNDGNVYTNLLTSKTKVAPIKPTTIPRLELNGALLLVRLLKNILESMHFQNVPVIAWTDSTIVLQWIKEHPSRWKTYVANRVVEIQETLRFENWRHISTKQNPADLASRGISTTQILNNNLWWHGPNWLIQDKNNWPKNIVVKESTTLEQREPVIQGLLASLEDNILLKYSSFTRLIRIVTTIQRAEIFNQEKQTTYQIWNAFKLKRQY